MKKQKESKRYREQRNKLNADISESRQNALQKVGTFIKRPRRRGVNKNYINNDTMGSKKNLPPPYISAPMPSPIPSALPPKKDYNVLPGSPILPCSPFLSSASAPPIPVNEIGNEKFKRLLYKISKYEKKGIPKDKIYKILDVITTDKVISETKISKQVLKKYYDSGLLFAIDLDHWPSGTIDIIKKIIGLEKQSIPIDEIRLQLYSKIIRNENNLKKDLEKFDINTVEHNRDMSRRAQKIVKLMDRKEWFFRYFDPLLPVDPKTKINCILHIAAHLESSNRDSDSAGDKEDFITVRRAIKYISEQVISKIPGFKLHLIISINGNIDNEKYIKYFDEINGTWLSEKVCCKVFQRPNFGYHWGGFYDVWTRYKETKCDWYVTLESDYRFYHDPWFDLVVKELNKAGPNFLDYGKHQNPRTLQPKKTLGVDIPARQWRNKNNSIKQKPTSDDLIHTCGALHFCKRQLLEEMDNAFGCFTYSMGCNHTIDGIIQGEVAFCQKIGALGYKILSKPIPDMVRALRGADCLKEEFAIIRKEMGEF